MQKVVSMKKIVLIIFVFRILALYAQSDDITSFNFIEEYNKAGRLCMENKLDSAIINLLRIEDKLLADKPFQSFNYAYTIFSLSDVYAKQNMLNKSIECLDHAVQVLDSRGEAHSLAKGIICTQYGQMYLIVEEVKSAKDKLLAAKEIYEKNGYDKTAEYALAIAGLSLVNTKQGNYFFSNILANKAGKIFLELSSKIGDNQLDNQLLYNHIINVMSTISVNFQNMGDLQRVSEINDKIKELSGNTDTPNANYLARVNKAYSEIKNGNIDTAIELLENTDNVEYGYMYKDYAYQNLIIALYLSNDDHVVDILKHYIEYSKNNFLTVFSSFSEAEREEFWSQRSLLLEMVTNMVCWKYQTPDLLRLAYDNTIYTKSMQTRFSKLFSSFALNNSSPIIKEKYLELTKLKKQITQRGVSKDTALIVKERINAIERDLVSSVQNYKDLFDDSQLSCDNVRKSLQDGEVAIEYILFPEYLSADNGIGYYGALISRPDLKDPVIVKLCEKELLDDILYNKEQKENEFVNKLYDLSNDKVYNLIFKPLIKYLSKGETIYFSPVGDIYKINVPAIFGDGNRLMDVYNFVQVSSTAKLIERKITNDNTRIKDAYMVGGIDYNEDLPDMILEAYNYSNSSLTSFVATRSSYRGAWDNIPGTLYEATQINSILNDHNINTTFLQGNKANEESFKELDGQSPYYIHIATHGFFYANKDEVSSVFFDEANSYTEKRLPMQYSGLLFAGANNVWLGKTLPNDVEDGILTAEEISQLNLSNTKLVVLSACDTGLGEVDNIDGVYGLQRGFKMAGVETIMMSLWKIPDEATSILMVEFYKNLTSGKSKQQSLKDAQNYLRQVENGKYDKPEYWASFIMQDGLN